MSTTFQAARKPHVVVVIAVIWIAAFLVSFDFAAVTVTLPTIARSFEVGTGLASWASLSYMLVMVALTLITGPIMGRLSPRLALTGSLGVFGLASLAASLSPGLGILVACRAAQGAGASIMFVAGPAMIKTMLPQEQHTRAFTVFSTAPMAGLAGGPAVGGELAAIFGWQSVLLPNLPLVTVCLLLNLAIGDQSRITRSETPPGAGMHFPGLTTMVTAPLALASLVLALNQGREWGWSSLPIMSLMGTFAAAGTVAVLSERGSRTPLLDRRVLMAKDFITTAFLFLLLLAVSGGLTFVLPFYFEWLLKLHTDTVGHILAVQPIATICVSMLSGVMPVSIARRSVCLAGISLALVGVTIYAMAKIPLTLFIPIGGLVLVGAGVGLYYPTLMQLSLSSVPPELAALASSLQTTIRVLAQMLGIVIFETLFSEFYTMSGDAGHAIQATGRGLETMQSAFQITFWFATIVVAFAIVPGVFLSKQASGPTASKSGAHSQARP